MRKQFSVAVAVAFAAAASQAVAAGPIADGNWLLSTVNATGESAQAILKVETKDGVPTATVLFTPTRAQTRGGNPTANPRKPEVRDFKVSDKTISFTFRLPGRGGATSALTFVGTETSDPKKILGSYGSETSTIRAELTATDKDKLDPKEYLVRSPAADAYSKAIQAQIKPARLQAQARQERDAEKKAQLLKEATEAMKAAETEVPKLYRDVLAHYRNTPAGYDAALALIRSAGKTHATTAEASEWVAVVESQAAMYGPRFATPALTQVADTLADVKVLSPIAVRVIEPMVNELKNSDSATNQVKVLTIYRNALENAGRTPELKPIDERLAKLEIRLDREYLASVPPFKPEPYAGRTEKGANQVVVMELFTGAQCPPCVAADVAFDALEKSYKPSDLILLQYHMHIPGPDPLTNPDTIARWDYYRAKFPQGIRGTPSTVFNGKPEAGGGGGMANSRAKYNQYRKIIDPMLEKKSDVKVAGVIDRVGDKLTASVTVSGADPSADLKLRLLVVEESIKYVGGNHLRFHDRVVRSMIGGPAGIAINDKTFKHTATANVGNVKKELTRYLDEFAANRPFPYKQRPMDLTHLEIIALVQNDKTLEILQSAVLESHEAKTSATISR